MKFFKERKDKEMINNLLSVENREKTLDKLTVLQNEISVAFNNKVIVITSIGEDALAAAFAKAFADAFIHNGSSALLIDANLYNPCLGELLSLPAQKANKEDPKIEVTKQSEKLGVVCLDKETYPGEIYKSGFIQELVKANQETYEHTVILMPSVKSHKDVSLMADILDSVLLIARRDVTKKSQVFYALQYLYAEKLPVSKTVILK